MRLTTVILIASLMQVSAATFGQRVTLKEKDTPLEWVIEKLRKQTGYDFLIMDYKLITEAKKVNLDVKNVSLEEALESIFENQKLSYTIKDKSVAIKEKEPSFLDNLVARFSAIDIRGKIVGENDQVLAGATVKVKGTNKMTKSNEKGEFYLSGVDDDAVLEISFVGFMALEIPLKGAVMPLEIKLNVATGELEEVKVVYNTGYQNIDKTRATGSFVQVDNELINRKVGTDILSRLEGVVPGLLFDRRPTTPGLGVSGKPRQNLQIRGLYTLTGAISQPLIVLDNFPFAGDLLDINPNDVENITVLKDAAAASIWGAKAGNGVIVITTKKGGYNQRFKISLNSNFTASPRPNLFSIQDMSVNEYIDVERFLFDKGKYNAILSNAVTGAITPVQEVLLRLRDNKITKAQADSEIDAFRGYDVRNEFTKYVYRIQLNQQYSINLSGGSEKIKYAVSGGFDKNLNSLKGSNYDRVTFRSNATILPFKNLEVRMGLAYSRSNTDLNNLSEYGGLGSTSGTFNGRLYSYARLADENGNALSLDLRYRKMYTDTAGNGKLLDWKYRPLDELNHLNNSSTSRNMVGDFNVKYDIIKGLSAEISYQYQRSDNEGMNINDINTYYTRDLINTFTQITGSTLKYNVPKDGILLKTNSQSISQNIRTGLNFNRIWTNKHELTVLGGAEMRENEGVSSDNTVYGYNERLNTSSMDFINTYPVYYTYGGRSLIPNTLGFNGSIDRFVSLYGNAAYTYNSKYTLSASARRDASNLFGVKTNDKGRPFWSVGASWNISDESFYKINTLPQLRARVTYGYSGNVNQNGRALTVINYQPALNSMVNLPFASIQIPGNPSLRWEKVRTFNSAIDFALKNQILSGSIEYYRKKSTDVIGQQVLDATTGINAISSNSANMSGSGIDIQLNAKIINTKKINYGINLGFSHEKYEVTEYFGNLNSLGNISDGLLIAPYKNPYSIISYEFAGLDPLTGDPLGVLNGQISKDYNSIQSLSTLKDNINSGSALPKFYGNLLNSLSIASFSFSANITYKLGYFFRRPTIDYTDLIDRMKGHSDYTLRWRVPGDEFITNVPSFVYPNTSGRDIFYKSSVATIENASQIRLEDVQLTYQLPKNILKKFNMTNIKISSVLSNLNILLYKANKLGLDPNFPNGYKTGTIASFKLEAAF